MPNRRVSWLGPVVGFLGALGAFEAAAQNTFTLGFTSATPGLSTTGIVLADVNADGKPDIVVAAVETGVAINPGRILDLPSLGGGNFGMPVKLTTGGQNVTALKAVMLTAPYSSIVFCSSIANNLGVFPGGPAGLSPNPTLINTSGSPFALDYKPPFLVVGVVAAAGAQILVYKNNAGNLTLFQTVPTGLSGRPGVVLGNFGSSDGLVVVGQAGNNAVMRPFALSASGVTLQPAIPNACSGTPFPVDVPQPDGSGRPLLYCTGNAGDPAKWVYFPDGLSKTPVVTSLPVIASQSSDAAAGLFDGTPGVVAAFGGGFFVGLLRSDNTFDVTRYDSPGVTHVANLADVNGDGRPDICVSTGGGVEIYINQNPCPAPPAPRAYFRNGQNTFDADSGSSVGVLFDTAGFVSHEDFELQVSTDPTFSSPTIATIPSNPLLTLAEVGNYLVRGPLFGSQTIYVRVRAKNSCGYGPFSQTLTIDFHPRTIPSVFVSPTSFSFLTTVGATPPAQTLELTDIGGTGGAVQVTAPTLFKAVPDTFTLPPGGQASTNVVLIAASHAPSSLSDTVTLTVAAPHLKVVSINPVTLTVVPADAVQDHSGTKAHASAATVTFQAPAGQNPASQGVTVTLDPIVGPVPIYLTPTIGPGGSWLVPTISPQIEPPYRFAINVAVDRTRRSPQDGLAPFRTLLKMGAVGASNADAAVIEVIDEETPVVQTSGGATRTSPPSGPSFIVPTTAKATSATGAIFGGDGWLKNEAFGTAFADLFFTPDGKDGITDAAVLKTTVSIPGGATRRLSDLLGSVFGASGSGQVEVRSDSWGALSLRTTVESVTGGDPASRYGTEIPTFSYGSGVGTGQAELVVPGIDEDMKSRANLILAETTGHSANVKVTVNDSDGKLIGTTTATVPAYGKVQLNRVVGQAAAGATLTGGWAGVSVTSGSGKVVAVATVIDNASGSFSAVKGRVPRSAVPSAGPRTLGAVEPQAASPSLVIPSVARLTGAFNTVFIAGISIANGTDTAASLTLTYHYIDVDDGNSVKSAQASVTIPPRGSLPKSVGGDVVPKLFDVTHRSYGWIQVGGDVAKVVAVATISAQVDPNDASKGFKSAQVDGILDDSPDVLLPSGTEHGFAGAEKSIQRRSNLILVETSGQPAQVAVRAYTAVGDRVAEKTFTVGANQYFQINDVFGPSGLALGDGPFQNLEVAAQIVGGTGKVIPFLTVNDNISRNPEIFVLRDPGPPTAALGF
jgi:hypothetical protein